MKTPLALTILGLATFGAAACSAPTDDPSNASSDALSTHPPPMGTIVPVPVNPGPDVTVAPSKGVLMGAYVHPDHDGAGSLGAVEALESAQGRKLDIDHRYTAFDAPMPSEFVWDVANGRIPMMSWAGADTDQIGAGKWDATIAARADQIKALGKPFLVRFMWEMDGAPNEAHFVVSAPSYITAWRRIVGIFEKRGATNARFLWCPTAFGFRPGGKATTFYPGDAYVSWVGSDGYNWAPGRGGDYKSFHDIFADFYTWAEKTTPNKPLFVGETGVQENKPGDKAAWIAAMGKTLETDYTRFKAIVYFDSDPKYPWWLDSTTSSMHAWKTLLAEPYFDTRK